mmetsp:Transcript_39963/g.102054  ORF Transcript_39963/g.102054 Transcript_39963/m.102054 type:complete len:193 (-) Transcript_39963:58-636(-)
MPSTQHFVSTTRYTDQEVQRQNALWRQLEKDLAANVRVPSGKTMTEARYTMLGAPIRSTKPRPSGLTPPPGALVAAPAAQTPPGSSSGRSVSHSSSAPALLEPPPPAPELRWPCGAIFERPEPGKPADFARRACLSTSARAHGAFSQPEKRARGEEKFINPFMNRFFERRVNGGFYAGSTLAAPKVTSLAAK